MIRESAFERWQRICGMVARFDLAQLRYSLWVRFKGLDFSGESCESLGIPEERASSHAHSGGPHLERVLDAIGVAPGSQAMDFGSGKGIATITLSRYFDSVTGVEMSPKLVEISKRNVAKLGLKNIQFICGDAGKVREGLEEVTHVYMFNPFPAVVMEEVMNNLRLSLQSSSRKLVIIYKNPICHDTVLRAGFAQRQQFAFRYTHPFVIYSN
ncbi:MAG TPA: methyltransferase domain-containing protein [Verrucomicrobiota bacterium]|nr:methyltransferase domain-containing protein [Verrucomicrobiota bacterium]